MMKKDGTAPLLFRHFFETVFHRNRLKLQLRTLNPDGVEDRKKSNSDIRKHRLPHRRGAECSENQDRRFHGKRKDNVLPDNGTGPAADPDRKINTPQIPVADHKVRSVNRKITAVFADRDPKIRFRKNRRIVDAVSDECNSRRLLFEFP